MKISINRLNHVQISIPLGEEQTAREFYAGVLGLTEIEKPEVLKKNGGLWFEVAGIQLHIGVEDKQEASKRHPAFEVEDLEDVRAYLRRCDVPVKEEPSIPGANRFSFFDPFGNRIEFLEMMHDR